MQNSLMPPAAARLVRLALDCVRREYPNHVQHLMTGEKDLGPPRELTPTFYGCFDWHSAVHGHWTLVRGLRQFPALDCAAEMRAVLNEHFTAARLAGEIAYLSCPARVGFERPYGLAWLLQLAQECREWPDPEAQTWAERFRPLEDLAVARVSDWLPKLTHPVRSGEHGQTAFAMGLFLDWAACAQNAAFGQLVSERALAFYERDQNAPLNYEPSGHDFLSPALAEADLLRRVLPPDDFSNWLTGFLPQIPKDGGADWLGPVKVADPADGKLAHLDGLNLSRAWMLEGIAAGLPPNDSRRSALLAASSRHAQAGAAAVTGEHYAGGHWLASFAVYLFTQRGLFPTD